MQRQLIVIFGSVLILGLWFLSAGCATNHHAPQTVDRNQPVVEAVAPVWIVRIDGRSVSRVGFTGHKQFTVTPGSHVLEIQYAGNERLEFENLYGQRRDFNVHRMSRENVALPFDAAPGHRYYIHAGREFARWRPYINETPANGFLELPTN